MILLTSIISIVLEHWLSLFQVLVISELAFLLVVQNSFARNRSIDRVVLNVKVLLRTIGSVVVVALSLADCQTAVVGWSATTIFALELHSLFVFQEVVASSKFGFVRLSIVV